MFVSRSQSLFIFIFGTLTSGCSETGLSGKSGAMIEVTPLSLGFGVFTSGSDPIIREFSISNIGSGKLNVEALEITGNNPGSFAIWDNPGTLDQLERKRQLLFCFNQR